MIEKWSLVCRDLHTGLECIRSYTRRCMSQQEREHFNKIYAGTNEMIRDLCSEGQYQEGTYVIFNLILIQFTTENCIFKFLWIFPFDCFYCCALTLHFLSWQIFFATLRAWEKFARNTKFARIHTKILCEKFMNEKVLKFLPRQLQRSRQRRQFLRGTFKLA